MALRYVRHQSSDHNRRERGFRRAGNSASYLGLCFLETLACLADSSCSEGQAGPQKEARGSSTYDPL